MIVQIGIFGGTLGILYGLSSSRRDTLFQHPPPGGLSSPLPDRDASPALTPILETNQTSIVYLARYR